MNIKGTDENLEAVQAQDNITFFHLERMSDSYWWMRIETTRMELMVNVGARRAICPANVQVTKSQNPIPSAATYELRYDDTQELDEIVACHPRQFHLQRKDVKTWGIFLITGEGDTIEMAIGTLRRAPVNGMIQEKSQHVFTHRCVICSSDVR